MHICALFYCCSILRGYAQRATNKAQFHLVPISQTETSPPSFGHALQRMQRYRSHIEVAFQRSPHGVDDRVYLKEKRQRETWSLKRILEKYIEEKKVASGHFFHFQEQFCTFPSEGKVCSLVGQKEGRDAVFFVCRSEVQGT